jgi:hypothetical protein
MKKKEYIKLNKLIEIKISKTFYELVHALKKDNTKFTHKKIRKKHGINNSLLTPNSLNSSNNILRHSEKISSKTIKNSSKQSKVKILTKHASKKNFTNFTTSDSEDSSNETNCPYSNISTKNLYESLLNMDKDKDKNANSTAVKNPNLHLLKPSTLGNANNKNKKTLTTTSNAEATAVTTAQTPIPSEKQNLSTTTTKATAAATAQTPISKEQQNILTTTTGATAAATAQISTKTTTKATAAATAQTPISKEQQNILTTTTGATAAATAQISTKTTTKATAAATAQTPISKEQQNILTTTTGATAAATAQISTKTTTKATAAATAQTPISKEQQNILTTTTGATAAATAQISTKTTTKATAAATAQTPISKEQQNILTTTTGATAAATAQTDPEHTNNTDNFVTVKSLITLNHSSKESNSLKRNRSNVEINKKEILNESQLDEESNTSSSSSSEESMQESNEEDQGMDGDDEEVIVINDDKKDKIEENELINSNKTNTEDKINNYQEHINKFSPPKYKNNFVEKITVRLNDKYKQIKRDERFFENLKNTLPKVSLKSSTDDRNGNIYLTVSSLYDANQILNSANFYPNVNKKILEDSYSVNKIKNKEIKDEFNCILLGVSMKYINEFSGLKEILQKTHGIMQFKPLAENIDLNSKAIKVKCLNEALVIEIFNHNYGNFEIKYQGSAHKVKLIPVTKPIRQCKQCGYLDHWKENCNTTPLCVKCCNELHTGDCSAPPHCINCAGAHGAFDKVNCEGFRKLQKYERDEEVKRRTKAYKSTYKIQRNLNTQPFKPQYEFDQQANNASSYESENFNSRMSYANSLNSSNNYNSRNSYTNSRQNQVENIKKTLPTSLIENQITNSTEREQHTVATHTNKNKNNQNIQNIDDGTTARIEERIKIVENTTTNINSTYLDTNASIKEQIEINKSLIAKHNEQLTQTQELNLSILNLIKNHDIKIDQRLDVHINNENSSLNKMINNKNDKMKEEILEYVNKNFSHKKGRKSSTYINTSTSENNAPLQERPKKLIKVHPKPTNGSASNNELALEQKALLEQYKNGTAPSQLLFKAGLETTTSIFRPTNENLQSYQFADTSKTYVNLQNSTPSQIDSFNKQQHSDFQQNVQANIQEQNQLIEIQSQFKNQYPHQQQQNFNIDFNGLGSLMHQKPQ